MCVAEHWRHRLDRRCPRAGGSATSVDRQWEFAGQLSGEEIGRDTTSSLLKNSDIININHFAIMTE